MEDELIKALVVYGPLGIFCALFVFAAWKILLWVGKRVDDLIARHMKALDTVETTLSAVESAIVESKLCAKTTQECVVRIEASLNSHTKNEEELMRNIANGQKQSKAICAT